MWNNTDLQNLIETESTIKSQAGVFAEWNLNVVSNIDKVGNYRYRHSGASYTTIQPTYDSLDVANAYAGATDSDIVVNVGIKNGETDVPDVFLSTKDKIKLYYSLDECLGRFRPRSGINKLRFRTGGYINGVCSEMASRPRFYASDKTDKFKYWTSERTQASSDGTSTSIVGMSYLSPVSETDKQYYIDDAAPFVRYKSSVPANRIVLKMQTGVGSIDLSSQFGMPDPFYGYTNQATPSTWKIQTLIGSDWVDALSFDSTSTRSDGISKVIGPDGYVELAFGITNIPKTDAGDNFKIVYAGTYSSINLLPVESFIGYTYLVKTGTEIGTYYIWNGTDYTSFIPNYGWYLNDESLTSQTPHMEDIVSPDFYVSGTETFYREFQNIDGIRIVIDTMNTPNSSFDLIEMSPRLSVNLTNKVTSFSITKSLSDLGISGMPIGQLLASTGSLNIFDYDLAFNQYNTDSLLSKFNSNNLQIKFYEIIYDNNGNNYYVPVKTLYAEGFPQNKNATREVSLNLRDLFFLFESTTAPQLFLPNASLSYIISVLLDSIGFSNYTIKRAEGEKDPIIPFFFVEPETSIAEVLENLAVSTQSAMYFDEYNNFVVMTSEYILPKLGARPVDTDITFYGSNDMQQNGVLKNETTSVKIANIIDIASENNEIFNDGKINYTQRYIDRTYADVDKTKTIDTATSHRNWIYKPVLLWEVSSEMDVRTTNGSMQSGYVLSAIPLASNLSKDIPSFNKTTNVYSNNTFELGESSYWLPRYSGYFYANGEIIKYDAVEYAVSGFGNVWITSVEDYVNYFSKMKFKGNIYPTGKIRIFTEIDSQENLIKHGRGQFGTTITDHYAELSPDWTNDSNTYGCWMKSEVLFNGGTITGTLYKDKKAGTTYEDLARKTLRSNSIRNFLSSYATDEKGTTKFVGTHQYGNIQASAFVMEGPDKTAFGSKKPLDFISYTHKELPQTSGKYNHFGTRMRIVGNSIVSEQSQQNPYGSSQIYTATPNDSTNPNTIGGSSGGMGIFVDSTTNVGYYFEMVALTTGSLEAYTGSTINNLFLYKVVSNSSTSAGSKAIPITIWSSTYPVNIDNGDFFGQTYKASEQYPTVFDVSIEYETTGSSSIKFYIYVNDILVGSIEDQDRLPIKNTMCLFVRGSSKVMFENVYAIGPNYGNDNSSNISAPIKSLLSSNNENATMDAFKKFATPNSIVSTYISGISSSQTPLYNMYYEEFGAIFREMAYMNIRYDKAYPALSAQISPTLNALRGYEICGFRSYPYGAEFLVFNITDSPLVFGDFGNYLRIQGITFTRESTNPLTVDDFFSKTADFSNPTFSGDNILTSQYSNSYIDVKNSRMLYGKKEFSLDAPYIQNYDTAKNKMEWMINKIMKPRKSIGVEIFPNPMIQLGDIVKIDYDHLNDMNETINDVATTDSRFVVYHIEYNRDVNGPTMNVYLSEVV